MGSSPLARGLPETSPVQPRPQRIIPARAGFTMASLSPLFLASDHPRSRGVYLDPWARQIYLRGIIPARAGFTSGARVGFNKNGDHPRSRGVYPTPRTPGPPPDRIIPARAGFTSPGARRVPGRLDHPRSRGVYRGLVDEDRLRRGSSPLARGLRPTRGCCPACPRIIPARAGFTAGRMRPARTAGDHPRSRGVYACSSAGRWLTVWIIPARAGFT